MRACIMVMVLCLGVHTHTQAHLITPNRGVGDLRDGVLLPSACYCAQSAFLCPSPLSPSPPPFSGCFCLFTTSTFTLLFVPLSFFILSSSSASSPLSSPLPCKETCSHDEQRAKPEPVSIRQLFALSLPPPSLSIPSLFHSLSLPSPLLSPAHCGQDRSTSPCAGMESTHRGLIAAQISQVESNRKK